MEVTLWLLIVNYDSSKRCVYPLYKFVSYCKLVKLFLEHPVYLMLEEDYLDKAVSY
jgi:hypothetical protein